MEGCKYKDKSRPLLYFMVFCILLISFDTCDKLDKIEKQTHYLFKKDSTRTANDSIQKSQTGILHTTTMVQDTSKINLP